MSNEQDQKYVQEKAWEIVERFGLPAHRISSITLHADGSLSYAGGVASTYGDPDPLAEGKRIAAHLARLGDPEHLHRCCSDIE